MSLLRQSVSRSDRHATGLRVGGGRGHPCAVLHHAATPSVYDGSPAPMAEPLIVVISTTAPKASNLLCGQRLILCFGEPMAGWLSGLHRPADFRRTRGVTMGKFELYKDHHGGFRWQLKSTEGRTIAVSAEAHKTMADLRENIATVKREAGGSDIDDQTATTF